MSNANPNTANNIFIDIVCIPKLNTTSMRSAIIEISTRSLMAICWCLEYSESILNDFTKTKINVTIFKSCSASWIHIVEVSDIPA